MEGKTKTTINIDRDLLSRVDELASQSPSTTRQHQIETLVKEALDQREKLTEQERMMRFTLFKTLYYMRQMVRARDEELLKKMDAEFLDELPEMEHLIREHGIDYEGR